MSKILTWEKAWEYASFVVDISDYKKKKILRPFVDAISFLFSFASKAKRTNLCFHCWKKEYAVLKNFLTWQKNQQTDK